MMSATMMTAAMMSTAENVADDVANAAAVMTSAVMSARHVMHRGHVVSTTMHHDRSLIVGLWYSIAMRWHGSIAMLRSHVTWRCHHGRRSMHHHGRDTAVDLRRGHHVRGTSLRVARRWHHAWMLLSGVAWRGLHVRVTWWCSCSWGVLVH